MTTIGPNVLAPVSNQSATQGYRPRLIEFYGYEGEDFRHFLEILESFLAISNIYSDSRKLVILKSQLRRAAKIYYENVILKKNPELTYDVAIEKLKDHYITSELIQSYELEFNEMYQGEQEHPQIFLARLREAADLANITSEEVIQSRFRAGLLRGIKQFCIQSSSKTFQEWINHAEGWWNANRPRKIAMVDNPFIPRNINNALIYHDEDNYRNHYAINNHNVEIIDTDEIPTQVVTINGTSKPTRMMHRNIISGPTRLTTMDINGHTNGVQYQVHHRPRHEHNESAHPDSQQEILNMVQQVIRNELNGFYQPNRAYNRNPLENSNKYNNNYRDYRRNNEHNGYQNNNGNGYNNNNGYSNRNNYNNNGYNKYRNNVDYSSRKPEYNSNQSSNNYNNQSNPQQYIQQQNQPSKN